MRRFIIQCTLFSLCFSVFIIYQYHDIYEAYQYYHKIDWKDPNSQADLFRKRAKNNEGYDMLMHGSSHVMFGPDLELKGYKPFAVNTDGGGIMLQQAYMRYFFSKGNTAKRILYFIDPWAIHNNKYDGLMPGRTRAEEFELSTFLFLLKEFGLEAVYNYSKTYKQHYEVIQDTTRELKINKLEDYRGHPREQIDTFLQGAKIKHMYGADDHFGEHDYKVQKDKLLSTINYLYSINQKDKLIFIIPPTLLGKGQPFREGLIEYLEDMKKEHGIPYYDFGDVYHHPSTFHYFNDHDHLNPMGQNAFNDEYLIPILKLK